jgi:hypothetical protein
MNDSQEKKIKRGYGGRPKGVANKSNRNAREAIAHLVEGNIGRMETWLDQIAQEQGPKAAWQCMMDVIEYHVPKLARTEHVGDGGGPLRIVASQVDERL